MSQGRKGIPWARERIKMALLLIETRAAPSKLKEDVLALLGDALFHTVRNKHKPGRAKRISAPVTPLVVMGIKMQLAENPDVSNGALAAKWNVRDGRVSEIRSGKYDHMLPEAARFSPKEQVDFFQLPLSAPKEPERKASKWRAA